MSCPQCGKEAPAGVRFCSVCGNSLGARSNNTTTTKGLWIFLAIALASIPVVLIAAAVVLPMMNKQLTQARETAAVQAILTIHRAETQYFSEFGQYATRLSQLGPPITGPPGPAAADFIPKDLSNGNKSGYIFNITGTGEGYAVTAVPAQFGSSGRRTFYSDQTLIIRNNRSQEPATVNSPPIE